MVGFDPVKSKLQTKQDHLLAGAGSGFATRFLCQPLDMLKIRLQLQIEPISKNCPQAKYQSISQAVRTIVGEEGVPALWKGHIPAQVLSVTYGAAQFVSFEMYTQIFHDACPFLAQNQVLNHLISGSMAGMTATLISQPFDVVRTRLVAQGNVRAYVGWLQAFYLIKRRERWRGLYRGLAPNLIQTAPYIGIQFGTYRLANLVWVKVMSSLDSKSMSEFERQSAVVMPSPVQSFVTGAISGFVSKGMVYPLDLIKKRLQIQGFRDVRENFGAFRSYRNTQDCIKKIYRDEKLLGFYKGFAPSMIKATLTTALHFTFYELIIQYLFHQNKFERSNRRQPPPVTSSSSPAATSTS